MVTVNLLVKVNLRAIMTRISTWHSNKWEMIQQEEECLVEWLVLLIYVDREQTNSLIVLKITGTNRVQRVNLKTSLGTRKEKSLSLRMEQDTKDNGKKT